MKKLYALTVLSLFSTIYSATAQEREINKESYQQIEKKLTDWDNVRGPWLAEALTKVEAGSEVPTRPFPERFTPLQMMQMVPQTTRSEMLRIANDARKGGEDGPFWNSVSRYISTANCQYISGRSYGDPHLVSFDGARNSFQTVGEFVLTKSTTGDMEVQVRQKAQNNDFSLNTASAMNVAGDRVCVYASDVPDGDYSTPVRLDGRPLHLNGSTYLLPHGGSIKKVNNQYTVYWPSGESVTTEVRHSGGMPFVNMTVMVSECNSGNYAGLLGNANGTQRDDYSSAGVAPVGVWGSDDYFDRKRQEYMAKDFAEFHRITQESSLFDYILGKNTMTYTDRSYPRVYRDFNDLTPRQLSRAQKHCSKAGVGPRDMQGCVYDQAYLGIDGRTAPVVPDPVQGTVLRPVAPKPVINNPDNPKPNVNQEVAPSKGETTNSSNNRIDNDGINKTDTKTEEPTVTPHRTNPQPRIEPSRSTPPPRSNPVPRPRPVPVPKTRTTPKPVPTPKPTPKPIGRIGGR